MKTRLLLFFDGTWQDDDRRRGTGSNVVRLRDMVQRGAVDSGGVRIFQRVYYDAGVGTERAWWERVVNGVTGGGLAENVREGYRYLSEHFRPDRTEIVLVGYSRGAFTARSLAGFMGASGLLRPEHCSPENEKRAWTFYRTPPKRRSPQERMALRALAYPSVPIEAIGVFDTVGALGVPSLWRNAINQRFAFHDTRLGPEVRRGFHALAINENRPDFRATLWEKPFNERNSRTDTIEQVWFAGSHGAIGGGRTAPPARGREADAIVQDYALAWMSTRLEQSGVVFDPDEILRIRERARGETELPLPYSDSFRGLFRIAALGHRHWRPVEGIWPPGNRLRKPRESASIGERLHVSAARRWQVGEGAAPHPGVPAPYRPSNLVAWAGAALHDVPPVVDWTGAHLPPDVVRARFPDLAGE